MSGQAILLLLVLVGQDQAKPDDAAARARRAKIVDEVMAGPPPAQIIRPAVILPPAAEPALVAPARVINRRVPQRRVMLEAKEVPPPVGEGDGDDAPPPIRMGLNIQEMAIARETFDPWIFGAQLNEESRRGRLDNLLNDKTLDATSKRKLNPDQIKKLRLAGVGDIKRYFDRVGEKRAEFDKARKDYNAGMGILNELDPLATEYQAGPFGPGSMFEKTLESLVDDTRLRFRTYEGTY